MFERNDRVILDWILKLYGARGLGAVRTDDPAARAYGQRQRELHEFNPDLAKAVDAVADARAHGAHITLGDPGFRKSVADVPLAKVASADGEDESAGPASRAIARRRAARRGDHER